MYTFSLFISFSRFLRAYVCVCVCASLSLSLSRYLSRTPLYLYFRFEHSTRTVSEHRPTVPPRGRAGVTLHSQRREESRMHTRNRETVATESTHPKTLKSSRGPRRGSRLGSGWLWWGGWRCGQWLRGWWGWKLRGGGCSSRSRRPLRGISLPLAHRGGGVNNSPARVPPSFRLCPALRQLMRLLPRAARRRSFSYFRPRIHEETGRRQGPVRGREIERGTTGEPHPRARRGFMDAHEKRKRKREGNENGEEAHGRGAYFLRASSSTRSQRWTIPFFHHGGTRGAYASLA